ncbi:MAG: efflux RND transporter permease subunit, partial [Pseudomonadota bacterium]
MKPRDGGVIALFARHPTAANLLMIAMLLVGWGALQKLNTQFFPDFSVDVIQVDVGWAGASAEDVDNNV